MEAAERVAGEPVTVAHVDATTGEVKYLHPEIAGAGGEENDGKSEGEKATEKDKSQRRRSSVGLRDPLAAREWTQKQKDRMENLVGKLHASPPKPKARPQSARAPAQESEKESTGGGRARARSAGRTRHQELQDLHEESQRERRGRSQESRGSRESLSPMRPRWNVPGRGLMQGERLTKQEARFQQYLDEKRKQEAARRRPRLEDTPEERQRILREAMLPWWERSDLHSNQPVLLQRGRPVSAVTPSRREHGYGWGMEGKGWSGGQQRRLSATAGNLPQGEELAVKPGSASAEGADRKSVV